MLGLARLSTAKSAVKTTRNRPTFDIVDFQSNKVPAKLAVVK